MTALSTEKDTFQDLLQGLWKGISQDDPLAPYRKKAWDHFISLGLPSRKVEVYRYIKLRHLFSNSFNIAEHTNINVTPEILSDCQQSVIVLVNGVYNPALSSVKGLPTKVVIAPLHNALRTYGTFLNNAWTKMLKEETDPFAALNAAMHPQGLFIYVPPKTVVEAPIQILNIVSTDAPSLIMPRIQLFVGAQSEVNIISSQQAATKNKTFVNQVIEMGLDEDAHVNYSQVLCNESDEAWHFDALRATLKRNAGLKTVQVSKGSATVRFDCRVALIGENAEAMLNGLWMLEGHREAHTNIMIDHVAPNCRSFQLFKGVLGGSSRSSFEGKIFVRKEAQKTEAFQKNPNLLISEHAHADSAPNLEIFADDVKASHGATVGQLDKDQLFYMKTRGIMADEAKRMLVRGFCQEVLDKLPLDSLKTIDSF